MLKFCLMKENSLIAINNKVRAQNKDHYSRLSKNKKRKDVEEKMMKGIEEILKLIGNYSLKTLNKKIEFNTISY